MTQQSDVQEPLSKLTQRMLKPTTAPYLEEINHPTDSKLIIGRTVILAECFAQDRFSLVFPFLQSFIQKCNMRLQCLIHPKNI
jgi:hypothetical protein